MKLLAGTKSVDWRRERQFKRRDKMLVDHIGNRPPDIIMLRVLAYYITIAYYYESYRRTKHGTH